VTDPVKVIHKVTDRVARLAAIQVLIVAVPALIVLVGAGFGLGVMGEHSWERWGLLLPSHTAWIVQLALWSAAAAGVLAACALAALSFVRSRDPVAAAGQLDRRLGCHEEVLTLAALVKTKAGTNRSGLFPVLWRRAAQHLDRLEPARVFPFQYKTTLRQAAFLTFATIGLMAAALSVLLAANKPPFLTEALQLRKIAREIADANPGDPQARQLAAHLREAAAALTNPTIPPQEKIEQLARVEQELKSRQQHQQMAAASKAQSGAQGSGKGNQGHGTGEGKEAGGNAQQGSGGAGKGNAEGKGSGTGTGQAADGATKLAQARADISRVQARLEAEAKQKAGHEQKNGIKGHAPRPGEQPDLASLEKVGNLPGLGPSKTGQEHNQEQGNSQRQEPGPRKDYGSSQGDTHLGQFPQPGNFEKFYKAGEHGIPMDVKNARYVLFRVPPAQVSAGGGRSVIDRDRPSATVPYANLPLKEERIAAEPDEQQLVPPRYRDLLR
jgi:hypothetical protein